jgi:hypothetical protein
MKLMNFVLITIVVEVCSNRNQLSQTHNLSANAAVKLESETRNATVVKASESKHLIRLV